MYVGGGGYPRTPSWAPPQAPFGLPDVWGGGLGQGLKRPRPPRKTPSPPKPPDLFGGVWGTGPMARRCSGRLFCAGLPVQAPNGFVQRREGGGGLRPAVGGKPPPAVLCPAESGSFTAARRQVNPRQSGPRAHPRRRGSQSCRAGGLCFGGAVAVRGPPQTRSAGSGSKAHLSAFLPSIRRLPIHLSPPPPQRHSLERWTEPKEATHLRWSMGYRRDQIAQGAWAHPIAQHWNCGQQNIVASARQRWAT